jgi:hypothetical protein
MARTSTKAVADLDSAIRAWGEAAQDVSRKASTSVKRLVADVEKDVQARTRRVAALESEIAAARGEPRARLARELQAATTALERGRRGLRQAKDAERRMQVLQRRVNEATNTRVPRASAVLKRKLAALEKYSTTSVPHADSAPHGAELSLVHKAGLTLGAIAGFVPSPTPGLTPHDANLQKAGDTAVSRPVNPDETKGNEGVLYKLVEHQSDQTHQLGHTYETQELKDAAERNRHLGEPGSHG